MKQIRYVNCECCNKKIKEGDLFYRFSGYCGIYCSPKCVAEQWFECSHSVLTDDEVENHQTKFKTEFSTKENE